MGFRKCGVVNLGFMTGSEHFQCRREREGGEGRIRYKIPGASSPNILHVF